MPQRKTSKRRLATIEKQQKACQLRAKGLTYERIGAEMGISQAWAQRLVDTAMQEMKANIIELANAERERQMIQTGLLLEKYFPNAESGDLEAAEMVIKILNKRAKLSGADMPDKIAPTTPDGDQPYDPITDAERSERIAAILDAAAKRRNLEASIGTEAGGTDPD